MAKIASVADVVEEMFQSILATPKRQRRLRSASFWDKFGFERRTKERVENVKFALQKRAILINFNDETFGSEDKDEWIILTHIEPELPSIVEEPEPKHSGVPFPPDSWFALMEQRVFESEREVECYFIVPLLEKMDYEESDFAIGYPVQMYEGVKRVNKEADFVMFNGLSRSKDDALIVVEAKKTERILTEDSVGQARAYSMWLTTPYYVVTNGDETRVYLFRGAVQSDVMLMTFKRADMRQHWVKLYKILNKAAAIEYKEKLSKILAANGM